jgi:multicomponent Na+:H+ antiporter subunit E
MEEALSKWRPAQAITLGIVIFALWLLLSGIYKPFLLGLGVVSTAIAVFFALRMELVDREGVPVIHLTGHLWTYLPWLVVQMIRSNIILHPNLPISPGMLRVRAKQRSDLGRVIFANSITLTPGTVTVAVVGETLHVHALDAESAGDMDEGEMNRRVAALERRWGKMMFV